MPLRATAPPRLQHPRVGLTTSTDVVQRRWHHPCRSLPAWLTALPRSSRSRTLSATSAGAGLAGGGYCLCWCSDWSVRPGFPLSFLHQDQAAMSLQPNNGRRCRRFGRVARIAQSVSARSGRSDRLVLLTCCASDRNFGTRESSSDPNVSRHVPHWILIAPRVPFPGPADDYAYLTSRRPHCDKVTALPECRGPTNVREQMLSGAVRSEATPTNSAWKPSKK
jgi:hypothetical protein